jgi:hypothetical protein
MGYLLLLTLVSCLVVCNGLAAGGLGSHPHNSVFNQLDKQYTAPAGKVFGKNVGYFFIF